MGEFFNNLGLFYALLGAALAVLMAGMGSAIGVRRSGGGHHGPPHLRGPQRRHGKGRHRGAGVYGGGLCPDQHLHRLRPDAGWTGDGGFRPVPRGEPHDP